jgi:hypothetical protein
MLNWRRDPGYEQRMRQLRLETEQLRLENAELDKKLRNFDALELRLKHDKPSSLTSPSHPTPAESSSSRS